MRRKRQGQRRQGTREGLVMAQQQAKPLPLGDEMAKDARDVTEEIARVQLVNSYRLAPRGGGPSNDTRIDLVPGEHVKSIRAVDGGVLVVDFNDERHFISHSNIRGFRWKK